MIWRRRGARLHRFLGDGRSIRLAMVLMAGVSTLVVPDRPASAYVRYLTTPDTSKTDATPQPFQWRSACVPLIVFTKGMPNRER